MLLITHYTRILRYIKPDFVHVFVDGRIVERGRARARRPARGRGLRALLRGARRRRRHDAQRPTGPPGPRAGRRAHPRGLPDPRRAPCAAGSRWSTSTPARRRRSRAQVLDAERDFYEQHNAAVHRGAHQLAEEATDAYESARARIAAFIGASADEIVFTKNATEGINLVAYAMSNAATAGAGGRAVPRRPRRRGRRHRDGAPRQPRALAGALRSAPARRCAGSGSPTTAGSTCPTSTADHRAHQGRRAHPPVQRAGHGQPARGGRPPRAHEVGALVVLDACQSVPHHAGRRARDWAPTSSSFSGHKMLGPTGIGVLWGRAELLAALPPFLTRRLDDRGRHAWRARRSRRRRSGSRPASPMTAQAIGLGAAVDYLTAVGMDAVAAHEHALTELRARPARRDPRRPRHRPADTDRPRGSGLLRRRRHPPARRRAGARLRRASRSAWDTTAPGRCMRRFAVPATTRATFYLYTTDADDRRARRGGPHGAAVLRGGVMQLEQMYQEIILDHYRHPHHRGLREPYDAEVHHVNPTCGDEVTVRVLLDGRRPSSDVSYDGQGCSISQASDLGDDRPGHRPTVDEALAVQRGVPRADAGPGRGRARRGACSRTPWRSPASRSSRPGSSARCSGGWHSRTRPPQAVRTTRRHATMTADTAVRRTTSTTSPRRCSDVVDPELGINVVDLGLVYGITSTRHRRRHAST